MCSSKSLRACLLQFKNDLRQRLVKQRFFKSVSLITGFEKTVLGCHSKGSSFGEQALAGLWYLKLKNKEYGRKKTGHGYALYDQWCKFAGK